MLFFCGSGKRIRPSAATYALHTFRSGHPNALRFGTALALRAKNSPPDCFLNAAHPLRVRIP